MEKVPRFKCCTAGRNETESSYLPRVRKSQWCIFHTLLAFLIVHMLFKDYLYNSLVVAVLTTKGFAH